MPTVSSSYLECYFETCVALGVPRAKLLSVIPGNAANLNDATARFSVQTIYNILKLALDKPMSTRMTVIRGFTGQHLKKTLKSI